MASIAQKAHLPPLGEHRRKEVGRELQESLVELVDLSLIGKQLHWSVVGELFRPVHEHLDELVDCWRDLADVVAERAVALGFVPDGQAGAVSTASELAPVERAVLESETATRELVERLADVAERQRARMERMGEIDVVTQDVLIDVVRTLEHQLWMLRVQLGNGAH
jgi:starvation-inducible DNA-binding protein